MGVVVGVVVGQRGGLGGGGVGEVLVWGKAGGAEDLRLSLMTGWAACVAGLAWRDELDGLGGVAGLWWRQSQPDPGRPRGRSGAGSSAPGGHGGRSTPAGLGGPGRAGAVPGALGLGGSCRGRGPRGLVVPRHPRPAWLSGAAEVWDSGRQGAGGVALAGRPGRPRPAPPRRDTPATRRGEGRGQGLEGGGGLAGGGSPHGARSRPTPPFGQSIFP